MVNHRFFDGYYDSEDERSTNSLENNPSTPFGVSSEGTFSNHNPFDSGGAFYEGQGQQRSGRFNGFSAGVISSEPVESAENTNGGFMFVRIPSSDSSRGGYDSSCFSPSALLSPEVDEGQPFYSIEPIQDMPRACGCQPSGGCETSCGCGTLAQNLSQSWTRRRHISSAHPPFPPLSGIQIAVGSGYRATEQSNRYSNYLGHSDPASMNEVENSPGPSSPPTQLDLTGDIRTANLIFHDQRPATTFATRG
ncbi:unnamed protein product [Schistocephalus solidus]|uniref:Uncharacterized protein n=1 Tax=Schistocephalus solidus TaxID=70667 RepID=A0A183S7L7_SCHSO|nr:unnamed protein product [Schistocephalus solidus]